MEGAVSLKLAKPLIKLSYAQTEAGKKIVILSAVCNVFGLQSD